MTSIRDVNPDEVEVLDEHKGEKESININHM